MTKLTGLHELRDHKAAFGGPRRKDGGGGPAMDLTRPDRPQDEPAVTYKARESAARRSLDLTAPGGPRGGVDLDLTRQAGRLAPPRDAAPPPVPALDLAAPRGAGAQRPWTRGPGTGGAPDERPVLRPGGSVRNAVESLLGLLGSAYEARGARGLLEMADAAVAALSVPPPRAGRREGEAPRPSLTKALDALCERAGACRDPATGDWLATRATKVAAMMAQAPAFDGESYLRAAYGPGGLLRPQATDDARRATSAMDLFRAQAPAFDEAFLEVLSQAKASPPEARAGARARAVARTVPDLGAALVLRALERGGYADDAAGTPSLRLTDCRFPTLAWAENVLADLRSVLDERDPALRGEVYSLLVAAPGGASTYSPRAWADLVADVRAAEAASSPDAVERRAARERYEARRAHYDARRAEFASAQRQFEPLQAAAVEACDRAAAFVRWARDAKNWDRGAREAAPRAPHPAEFEYREGAAEPEVRYVVDGFDMSWLDVNEPEIIAATRGAGIDGWRMCLAGELGTQLWRVIVPPTYQALDFAREHDEFRMIVIAPRREGGRGVDFDQRRVVKLEDYMTYFVAVRAED